LVIMFCGGISEFGFIDALIRFLAFWSDETSR
jgi:hypothetical protein